MRQLVITGQGRDRNFDNRNLEGVNLLGANLAETRFIGANLCKANLQQADLSGAILVRSQLELANLTGVNLTGACIENWGVTKTTKLDGIICKHIFLSFVNEDKRNRLPSEGEFPEGEFTQFVKSILDSFDLFQNRELNPKAAISTLQGLADKYQEIIEILGLENRDNNTAVPAVL
ncbi:pentapeptide repeat-containing protein [Argonema antarcticum]|uniref:pentapeptide repeat-containing protein n=1 Tax=Argonema antarcticum TaxID=2942763 RepID=UPI003B84B6A4